MLEALASTKLNLLFDCCFNKEVATDSAIYWTLDNNNLKNIIDSVEELSEEEIHQYDLKSTNVIVERYNWKSIVEEYEGSLLN